MPSNAMRMRHDQNVRPADIRGMHQEKKEKKEQKTLAEFGIKPEGSYCYNCRRNTKGKTKCSICGEFK